MSNPNEYILVMRHPNTWLELKPSQDLETVVKAWKHRIDLKNRAEHTFMESGINRKGTVKNK